MPLKSPFSLNVFETFVKYWMCVFICEFSRLSKHQDYKFFKFRMFIYINKQQVQQFSQNTS